MKLFAPLRRFGGSGDGADHFRVALLDIGGPVRRRGLCGELRVEATELVPAAAVDAEAFGGEDFVAGLWRC